MQVVACVRRSGLGFISRVFSRTHLHHQNWSPATSQWHQNLDSKALKTFQNGKRFLHFHELILNHKIYPTYASATVQIPNETQSDENPESQALNSEDQENPLHNSNIPNESSQEKHWNMVDARREICQVVQKGDNDMEETLTQLGVRLTPLLVRMVLAETTSPSWALRFFRWAKRQPGFKYSSSTYDALVNTLGRSKDFEALRTVLSERLGARCNTSAKTFSLATAWHDDYDMFNEVIEIIKKLALSPRRHAYEMLIASLCKNNHVNAALKVLEKLQSTDCGVRVSTFRPFILFYCQKNQMDKVQQVFEMMKMKGCPLDSICYNLILSVLCNRKRFAEAAKYLGSMVNIGCKPDAITYDIMIHAACMIGRIQGACELFDRLREEGINPLRGTYINLLNGLFQTRGFDEAHSFLIQQSGKDSILDSIHYEYLIRVCSKSGLGQEARQLLMEMKARDLDLPDDQLCN